MVFEGSLTSISGLAAWSLSLQRSLIQLLVIVQRTGLPLLLTTSPGFPCNVTRVGSQTSLKIVSIFAVTETVAVSGAPAAAPGCASRATAIHAQRVERTAPVGRFARLWPLASVFTRVSERAAGVPTAAIGPQKGGVP